MNKNITNFALSFSWGCRAIILFYGIIFITIGRFIYPLQEFNNFPIIIFVYGFIFFSDLLKIAEWSINNLKMKKWKRKVEK
jgi:hypothetical protein